MELHTETRYLLLVCLQYILVELHTEIKKKEVSWEWATVVPRLRIVLLEHLPTGFSHNHVGISCYFSI